MSDKELELFKEEQIEDITLDGFGGLLDDNTKEEDASHDTGEHTKHTC
jgi:hypothetical protein